MKKRPSFTILPFYKAKTKSNPKFNDSQKFDENALDFPYALDAETFFEKMGFPEDIDVWEAYLVAKENYLRSSTLDQDHIGHLFARNILFPAQVLTDFKEGSFGEEATSITPALIASLLWRSMIEFPEISQDMLCTPMVLDIAHDLYDYYQGTALFERVCPEAQAVIKSIQICDIAEAANVMDNWARKLQTKELTAEDVDHAKALYQKVLMERFIDPEETALDGLLHREMERLRTNIADDRAILTKKDKRATFKLI